MSSKSSNERQQRVATLTRISLSEQRRKERLAEIRRDGMLRLMEKALSSPDDPLRGVAVVFSN